MKWLKKNWKENKKNMFKENIVKKNMELSKRWAEFEQDRINKASLTRKDKSVWANKR